MMENIDFILLIAAGVILVLYFVRRRARLNKTK